MGKETKRQLILTCILLSIVVGTMYVWYDNFVFHTYANVNEFQYVYGGENNTVGIEGYELYKDGTLQVGGGARIVSYENDFIKMGDVLYMTVTMESEIGDEVVLNHEYKVRADNEVIYIGYDSIDYEIPKDAFEDVSAIIRLERSGEDVYQELIDFNETPMKIYSGINQKYTMRNVYVTSSWIKTGKFFSNEPNIQDEYPYITMDYLISNEDLDDINDYERILQIRGETETVLESDDYQVYFYDDETSLFDKRIICVITLSTELEEEEDYTFMIEVFSVTGAQDETKDQ